MSLSSTELLALRSSLGREPSPAELLFFDAVWSEHCSYKSSKHIIERYLPFRASNVVLGPGEDAGIVRLETGRNALCLVVSHESHNHPSQVLPFEGAATGVGGIVRDVYCMGAEVIGVMDCLRFGNPSGALAGRVKEIAQGVVEGIWKYGNALGVPNVGGDIYFDESFDHNCIVNVVAIGVLKEMEIVRSFIPEGKEEYVLLLVGKPTDRTGVGGASFASRKLGEASVEEERVSVQVPDPFLKRVLAIATREVLEFSRKKGIHIGMKDLGAGGIGCAFSEMALLGGKGANIDLDEVPLEEKMPPQFVLCSETQERYVLAVPSGMADEICRIYNTDYSLPGLYKGAQARVIGRVLDEPRFVVSSGGEKVCDFPLALIKSCPRREVEGVPDLVSEVEPFFDEPDSIGELLVRLISSPNLCSREYLYRYYDSEVQGRAIIRPGEADACVFLPDPELPIGVAAGMGGNPFYGNINPYWCGALSVAEAVRNVVSAGASPRALTDCLNFGNPEDGRTMWKFSETVRGMGDAARGIGMVDLEEPLPFVSGNVSLHNYTEMYSVPPSPVVACYGVLADYSRSLTVSLKKDASWLILLGERRRELGGSAYYSKLGIRGGKVPRVDFPGERALMRLLLDGMKKGMFLSCHDISDGGLGVALLEMCFPSIKRNLGFEVDLSTLSEEMRCDEILFSESSGFIVEVPDDGLQAVIQHFEGGGVKPFLLGRVTDDKRIRITHRGNEVVSLSVDYCVDPWKETMEKILS